MRNLSNVCKSLVYVCVCERACVSVGNGNAQMHLIFYLVALSAKWCLLAIIWHSKLFVNGL